jgi:hypothetical protein
MAKQTPKVNLKTAKEEFDSWLDYKKIKDHDRLSNKDSEEIIIAAISEGSLILNEDKSFKYTLDFPVKSDDDKLILSELTFIPRLQVYKLNSVLKSYKATDAEGRMLAYMKALTGEGTGRLDKMDLGDHKLCRSIVMYFL